MRSRVARVTCGVVAWIALGAAAFFTYQSEKQLAEIRTAARSFDVHAREAADALADLRASQQAYVAAGQGAAFWMPKVTATLDSATSTIAMLRQGAVSAVTRTALDEASRTITEFGAIDARAR